MPKTLLTLIALNLWAGQMATAEPGSFSEAAVSSIFLRHLSEDGPGCAVGVIVDGRYRFKINLGMANLEHNIPINSQSVFRIGSVSKQFTGAAVALLAQQGAIHLDDDIRKYLPELPDYGHQVTLRQMLHHISGMSDYEGGPDILPTATGQTFRFGNEDYLTIEEFYQATTKMPLRTPPETEWYYSNTAYFLLSQLVHRASKKSLREFAREYIFEPLDMRHSFFNDDVNQLVKNRADGYIKDQSGWKIFMTNLSWVGDGGVYTTIDDFLAWDQNFYQNRLGRSDTNLIPVLLSRHPVATPEKDVSYGFGIVLDTYRSHQRLSHGGSWVGYRAAYAQLPKLGMSTVAFCNFAEAEPETWIEQVMDLYIDSL